MSNDEISIIAEGGKVCFLIPIRLNERELEQIKGFAAAQGVSVGELCERIVRAECGSKVDERPE